MSTVTNTPVEFDFDAPARDIDLDGKQLDGHIASRSPNAIRVNLWDKFQGKHLVESPIAKLIEQKHNVQLSEHDMTDSFAALYNKTPTTDPRGDAAARAWWESYFESEEGRKLRRETVHDHDLTEILCWGAARELKAYLANASEDAGTENESESDRAEREASSTKAARQGNKDAETITGMMGGMGDGVLSSIPREDLYNAFERARNSPFIRKVLNSAGRMLEYALSRRKELLKGKEQSNGVTIGNKISRLTSSERMKLLNAGTRDQVIRRLETNSAMLKDKAAYKNAGKGPVIAIVDESGSMGGQPLIQAKGIACALAWLARIDKRWVTLIGFSCSTNTLTLTPDTWDQNALLDWIEHDFGGGTNFDVLAQVCDNWDQLDPPKGKTDLLFITDGHGHIAPDRLEKYQNWRKANEVTCMGMAIGYDVDILQDYCDQAWRVDEISESQEHTQTVLDTAAEV